MLTHQDPDEPLIITLQVCSTGSGGNMDPTEPGNTKFQVATKTSRYHNDVLVTGPQTDDSMGQRLIFTGMPTCDLDTAKDPSCFPCIRQLVTIEHLPGTC